jgi:hypothetical protein
VSEASGDVRSDLVVVGERFTDILTRRDQIGKRVQRTVDAVDTGKRCE